MAARCRHGKFWVILSASCVDKYVHWCPECGAIRANHWPGWVYPDGQDKALARYMRWYKKGLVK